MIYVLAGGVVVFGILVYVLFMIFLPEWVGITGKVALKNQREHRGETPSPIPTDLNGTKNTDNSHTKS